MSLLLLIFIMVCCQLFMEVLLLPNVNSYGSLSVYALQIRGFLGSCWVISIAYFVGKISLEDDQFLFSKLKNSPAVHMTIFWWSSLFKVHNLLGREGELKSLLIGLFRICPGIIFSRMLLLRTLLN